MCLLLRKSELSRLVLGIITMFILCLPEFFKIHEANTIIVSCVDTCSSNNTTFPLCTFNNSCKRSVQQRREIQTILLKAIVNHSNFQNILCICQTSRREQQSHTKHTECEYQRDVNVDHQGSGSTAKKIPKADGTLEVKTEDVIYFYKYLNLTTFSEEEEVEHNTYYLLEIHINNSIVGRRNAAEEYLNHSCLVAMMEDKNDCINVSLQLKSYMEYPMCMVKIIWLTMIAVVFVLTISVVICKIVQENEQNHYKRRVAAVSAILRRKSSRHARRAMSAPEIHPFPEILHWLTESPSGSLHLREKYGIPQLTSLAHSNAKLFLMDDNFVTHPERRTLQDHSDNQDSENKTSGFLACSCFLDCLDFVASTAFVKTSKQQIPLTAQTTKILPIISEQDHCHMGASAVEEYCVLDNSIMLTFLTNAEERRNLQMISEENHVFEINNLLIKFPKQKILNTLSLLHQSEEVARSWFQLGTQTSLPLLTFSSPCTIANCFKKSRCKETSLKRNVQ